MADKTNINPNTTYEEALLYRSLEERGEPTDELYLPEPTPADEWLMKEAGGDVILHGLLLSTEQNEQAWADARAAGLDQDELHHQMDQYDLARWGLHKAIEKRKQELSDKRTEP